MDAGQGSCVLPGAVRALAVGQGCAMLQFSVFGPSGAATALEELGRLQSAPTHTHSKQAWAHCSLSAMGTSLNIQPLIISRRRLSQ